MNMLQGCSELQETARLVGELLQGNRYRRQGAERRTAQGAAASPLQAPVAHHAAAAAPYAATPVAAPVSAPMAAPVAPAPLAAETAPAAGAHPAGAPASAEAEIPVAALTAAGFPTAPSPGAPLHILAEPPQLAYRGDRLEHVLASMCSRGGLSGAVVADGQGLPLADFQSPVGGDVLAAFTSVLGGALERAGLLLGAQGAENISMDLNYTDKVVLRRFAHDGEPYFIMVICSQDLDERSEVELSIEQITSILTDN